MQRDREKLKKSLRILARKYEGLYSAQKFFRACMYSTPWMPYVRTKCKSRSVYVILGILSVPFGFINYFLSPTKGELPPKGLAIVGIIKNEEKFIKEWIEYYILSGTDKIILFDNGSTDQTAEIVKRYVGGYDRLLLLSR